MSIRRPFSIVLLACASISASAPRLVAQGPDTTAVPRPPAARLAALAPFFGLYAHDANVWMGAGPFRGTLDVGPAVKGWYVEWVIDTHYGPIDRQLRMLTTWDESLQRYRIWRFETLPQSAPGMVEGEGRFEGEDFVMTWPETAGPRGELASFRNRIRLDGPDTLVVVSEVVRASGEVLLLGTWTNRRVIAAPADPQRR